MIEQMLSLHFAHERMTYAFQGLIYKGSIVKYRRSFRQPAKTGVVKARFTMPGRSRLSSLVKEASAAFRLPRLLGFDSEHNLTTLLFHRFFRPGESLESGRERLRRQLQWLRSEYSPLTPAQAVDGLANATLAKFPILVTVDDVSVDFLKVADIFRSFDVPVVLFACVGWSDISGPAEPQSLLARIVALLQWGEPIDLDLSLDRGSLPIRLSKEHRTNRNEIIDRIILAREEIQGEFEALAARLEPTVKARTCCSWNELKDLASAGATIGCHSVSHVHLAQASKTRMAFEIEEARKIILMKFGSCRYFAYPYGKRVSYSQATTAEIKRNDFACAFLTHADFAGPQTDRYLLPRLVIPDDDCSPNGFRAIVRGGGIPFEWVRRR